MRSAVASGRLRIGRRCGLVAVGIIVLGCGSRAAPGPSLAGGPMPEAERVVDLTHPFDSETIYWPTATPFRLTTVARGETSGGYWYAANDFVAAEHGGTHLDAPIHFAEHGWSTEEIPLDRLMGPAVVVDISERAGGDPDAELLVSDLNAWEARHGRIPAGAIVLLHSGWGARWPDRRRYLGTAEPGDTSGLRFPGFSERAARFLVEERVIDAVGTDTASIDPGRSRDFGAHRVLAARNVPVLENVAHLERLPPRGAEIIALPMKIRGGTGGPVRIVAILPAAGRAPR
jgi:kynurenine formamidase